MPFQYSDRSISPPGFAPNRDLALRPLVTLATASVGQVATANASAWIGTGNTVALQWFRNNSAITNATNGSHSIQSAGTYRLGVTLTSNVRNRAMSSADFVVA
jgi:hypothetical protein